MTLIKDEFPELGIAVAGYPETHREAPSPEVDLANLKRKVEAVADVVITQLFYDNADFFKFRERCDKAGIRVPIVPGILPVTNLAQIRRITSLCGAGLPQSFQKCSKLRLTCLRDSSLRAWTLQFGSAASWWTPGVPGLHFYVLNKSPATVRRCQRLGAAASGEVTRQDPSAGADRIVWVRPA